jgi:hypothetical protein
MVTYLILKDQYAEEIKNDSRFGAHEAVDPVCRPLHCADFSQNDLVLIRLGITCGPAWLREYVPRFAA